MPGYSGLNGARKPSAAIGPAGAGWLHLGGGREERSMAPGLEGETHLPLQTSPIAKPEEATLHFRNFQVDEFAGLFERTRGSDKA